MNGRSSGIAGITIDLAFPPPPASPETLEQLIPSLLPSKFGAGVDGVAAMNSRLNKEGDLVGLGASRGTWD